MRALHVVLTVSLALSASAALGTFALAQDPTAATVSAPPSLYTWTGPYGGAFVGYNRTEFDQAGGPSFDGDGFIGGVYTGFNVQNGGVVFGLEADVGGSNVDATGFNSATGLPAVGDAGAFGSVRGRVGVPYDPFLFFATGGVAVADNELALGGASDSNTHIGWTVGAGVEASVTDNLSSRVEYRYTDYESRDYNLGNVEFSSGFDEHSIRAGLALRF